MAGGLRALERGHGAELRMPIMLRSIGKSLSKDGKVSNAWMMVVYLSSGFITGQRDSTCKEIRECSGAPSTPHVARYQNLVFAFFLPSMNNDSQDKLIAIYLKTNEGRLRFSLTSPRCIHKLDKLGWPVGATRIPFSNQGKRRSISSKKPLKKASTFFY